MRSGLLFLGRQQEAGRTAETFKCSFTGKKKSFRGSEDGCEWGNGGVQPEEKIIHGSALSLHLAVGMLRNQHLLPCASMSPLNTGHPHTLQEPDSRVHPSCKVKQWFCVPLWLPHTKALSPKFPPSLVWGCGNAGEGV